MKNWNLIKCVFSLMISLNSLLAQEIQVEIDGLELNKYDTINVLIKPILSKDTLEKIPLTSKNLKFVIDYKFATGENLIHFNYLNQTFNFIIEYDASKILISIQNETDPACILRRRYHSCDNSGIASFGQNCNEFNYCITNFCYRNKNLNGTKVISKLDDPTSYIEYIKTKKNDIDERKKLLNSANGIWYFHKVAESSQNSFRKIKKNECGFRDSLKWNFLPETLIIEEEDSKILVNKVGRAELNICTANPINYNYEKVISSCPSEWYTNYQWRDLIFKIDNSGLTPFTYRIGKNKLFLHQVKSDENGYSIRGKRYILKKSKVK